MTADRKWMEQLGFELEDKGSMIPLWVVVDDCGCERPASLAEIVLWTSLTAPPAPAAPAEPTQLRRADGALSGVFIETVASGAATVAADLRNWLDFLPGHAQPTIEQAVRLLETRP